MNTKQIGLSGSTLKLIAIIAMLIDHVGAGIFPYIWWYRYIGRLTMPIMCFFIAEGFQKTSNVKAYAVRLLIFALLSEIPFQIYFHLRGNVLFTLLAGLLFIWAWRDIKNQAHAYGVMALILIAVSIPGYEPDYGLLGVAMVALAWIAYRNGFPLSFRAMGPAVICGLGNAAGGLPAPLIYWPMIAGLLLCLYNGKRGFSMKYLFYAFYPLHLLALWFIRSYILHRI